MKIITEGYTLVELLVVMLISIMFLGLGYARYRDFSRRQEVDIAKRQIEGDLRTQQQESLAGHKPQSGCSGQLIGHVFDWINTSGTEANPPHYQLYVLCSDDPTAKLKLREKSISPNLVVTLSESTQNPIIFRPLTYGTNLGVSELTYTISNSAFSGNDAIIKIRQEGDIR